MQSSLDFDASGTSFHGTTVKTTLRKLLGVLSNNYFSTSKTTHDWVCKTSEGEIFTVYNWKTGLPSMEQVVEWHIGGFNKESTERAKVELEKSLRDGSNNKETVK
jgi:hypothetical protein